MPLKSDVNDGKMTFVHPRKVSRAQSRASLLLYDGMFLLPCAPNSSTRN
jgi:hypothetical protein